MQLMFYEKLLKNMKDKTDRVLELLENPSMYDDVGIREMLNDHETAEIYRTINKTADALSETAEPDIDLEWKAFVEKNHNALFYRSTNVFRKFLSRKIVASMFFASATLGLVAACIGISTSVLKSKSKDAVEIEGKNNYSSDNASVIVEDTLTSETPPAIGLSVIIYEDVSLEKIINDMTDYYNISATYKSDAVKDLHLYFQWNRSQSLNETVSQLNHFQQIKIKMDGNTIIVE